MAEKRNIFEEVDAPAAKSQATATGVIDRGTQGARGAIRVWLMSLFLLVVVMIAVGGATRLTDSGLSITEWAPITGAVPPLSAEDWQSEFERYQQIDEFRLQNAEMTMAEFKVIYWWEWGHRQLGRFMGLVWAIGFVWFHARRQVPPGWSLRLFLPGLLGGVQGAIGWWMVSSGLEPGMLDVASYRLAIHLGLAFGILGLLAWLILRLGRSEADLLQARRDGDRRLWGMTTGLLHLTFLQILLGALVAGIDAGRAFPQWPLMAGGIFPPDPFTLTPFWRNFFEDAGLVQFIHRTTGYVLFLFGLGLWITARRSARQATRFAINAAFAMLCVQMLIGIATVLYSAPVLLALLHQFGAVVLMTLILRARFLARYPLSQTISRSRA